MQEENMNQPGGLPTPPSQNKVPTWLILAIVIALVVLVGIGVFAFYKKYDVGQKQFDYSQTKTTKNKDAMQKDKDSMNKGYVKDDTGQDNGDDGDDNDTDPGPGDDPVEPIADPVDPGVAIAFPGAEGPGTKTVGGRGGEVIKVTNTNHEGPGSLLEALESSGPRIIVFETGGTIDLEGDSIRITDPYVTVAGQTAPGDGIQITNGQVIIQTHDVVIRGMRFRVGSQNGEDSTLRGVMMQGPEAYNIVLDHNSVSWGRGGNFYVFDQAHDITISWNIIAEALTLDGSKGLTHHKTAGENIASHHNVLISNKIRSPQTKAKHNEVINNFVYNYGRHGTNVWLPPGSTANVVNNVYVPGPDTKVEGQSGITIANEENPRTGEWGTTEDSLYLSGNVGPGRETVLDTTLSEEWSAVFPENGAQSDVLVTTPFSSTNITVHPASSVQSLLLAADGAGAIVPTRDAVDERIIAGVYSNTGRIIDTQDQVGGWDTLAAGVAPQDSDDDGMPDTWEENHGTNPNVADDDGDIDNDGYTNIEEYINSFFD
ncbi:MAG: hypothetical protein ACPGO5_00295 [Patescibacteria group bacterium]